MLSAQRFMKTRTLIACFLQAVLSSLGDNGTDPSTWQQKVRNFYQEKCKCCCCQGMLMPTQAARRDTVQGAALTAEMMRLKAIEEASEQHQSQLEELQVCNMYFPHERIRINMQCVWRAIVKPAVQRTPCSRCGLLEDILCQRHVGALRNDCMIE
jgi:hypothetical protein